MEKLPPLPYGLKLYNSRDIPDAVRGVTRKTVVAMDVLFQELELLTNIEAYMPGRVMNFRRHTRTLLLYGKSHSGVKTCVFLHAFNLGMSVIKIDRRDESNASELMNTAFDIAFKKQPCIVLFNEPFVMMRVNGARLGIIDQLERVANQSDTNRGVFVVVRTEQVPPRTDVSIDPRFWEYIDTEMFVPLPKHAQRMDIVRHVSVMICGQQKILQFIEEDLVQFLASVTRFETCGNIALIVARMFAEHAIFMATQMQVNISDLKAGDVRLIPKIQNAETTLENYSLGPAREHWNYKTYFMEVRNPDYTVKISQSTRLIPPSATMMD